MIEIDDAGGGCFIGPEVLAIHRLESNLVRYLYIQPYVKERILCATKLLRDAFVDLNITKNEPIKLCRGEIFDLFEVYLQHYGYQVIRDKVSEATDQLAEDKFQEILCSYGFPENLTLQDRNYREFYDCVGLWYYTMPRNKANRLLKVRLRPPARSRQIAQKYPNLLRIIFEEKEACNGTA